jgi:perosamine synthetase
MTIPVMRPWLGAQEAVAAAAAVLDGSVAQGPRVAEFEEAFAAATGAVHAVALSSGTAALHLALIAAGIGPGDEVVLPSLSFIATANAARYVGARPIFADVDDATQNLTAATVEPHLTSRTRAVILVDQAGVPADLDGMQALCEPRGVTVIEDAACATGSTYRGRPAGAGASLAAFSFHQDQILTTGEGGMLTTSNGVVADRLRRLREHGRDVHAARHRVDPEPPTERYLELGFNFRMTDVQAAIGLVQLRKLGQIVARRRHLARRYQDLLGEEPGLVTAGDPDHGTTNYQSFWVVLPADFPVSRDEVLRMLAYAGVGARRGITAAHAEPAYAGLPCAPLPATERLSSSALILPLFHQMTEPDQDVVVSVIRAAARARTPAAGPAGEPAPAGLCTDSALMPALVRRAAGAARQDHIVPRT